MHKMYDEKIRLLIVEDEETWMLSLTILSESLGFEIAATATNVETAIQMINSTDFDIALLDIAIGATASGISLGQLIRGTLKKPFIFITANKDSHTLKEAAAAKPSAYLLKPVDKNSLFIAIHNALENFIEKGESIQPETSFDAQSFFTKKGKKYSKVYWSDVVCLTSEQKYTVLELLNDNTVCHLRSSLQNTINHIVPKNHRHNYIQINRGQYLNIKHIIEMNGSCIITNNKSEFYVSDSHLSEVKKALNFIS